MDDTVAAAPAIDDPTPRWASDVVLRDGGVVHVRAATPADAESIVGLLDGLSNESRVRRFLSPGPAGALPALLSDLGTERHQALVAEAGGVVVGVVECLALPTGDRAEVAFAVADDHQHRGLGTTLLQHVAAFARTRGIGTLVASTLADNGPMLAVFREAGFDQRRSTHVGVVDVELTIESRLGRTDVPIVGASPVTVPTGFVPVLRGLRAFAVVCGGPALVIAGVLVSAVVSLRSLVQGDAPPAGAVVVLVGAVVYGLGILPWTRRWGTVKAERCARLPGDEFVPRAGLQMTRAVTIDASPELVWTWLAQIGADRGGFYSYAWLENLAGCRLRNATDVRPEWQHTRVDELVMLHPLHGIPITRLEPPWAFAMGGWYFALEARPEGRTRLFARTRVPRGVASWAYALFVEFPHFVMERRMLVGIRTCAEAAPAVRSRTHDGGTDGWPSASDRPGSPQVRDTAGS